MSTGGEDGTDFELCLVFKKFTRYGTLSKLPELLCLGGSTVWGPVVGKGLIPYIDGKEYRELSSRREGDGMWELRSGCKLVG